MVYPTVAYREMYDGLPRPSVTVRVGLYDVAGRFHAAGSFSSRANRCSTDETKL